VIADWCGVDVVGDDGRIRRLALAHSDPETERRAREVSRRFPINPAAETGAYAVTRTGRSILIPDVTDELLTAIATGEEQLHLLLKASIRSYMCVPLNAHGHTLGALTLVTADSGRRFGTADLVLAEDLASRAAIAVDNARLFREAQRTAADLRVANRAKDEFLGLVSHELRTPITTIYGNAQVMRTRARYLDPESLRLAVADIEQEAERLDRIVENMLVLARMEAGHGLVTEPQLVQRLVTRLVETHRLRHPHRRIDVHIPHDLEPVAAEATYFEQILRNLLSNAEKYSPRSAPIEVHASRSEHHVEVLVLDRGRGIAPEEAEHIFQAFYRSPRTENDASGAGIGLAVCKRLVEAQSGRVWARTRDGGGSEFGFALPLVKEATT
jgi:K+-sensing histidine kinase KdpD